MNKSYLIASLFLFLSATLAEGQLRSSSYCGTSAEKSPWLVKYQANPQQYDTRNEEILVLPMVIHLVGEDNGTGYYPLRSTYRAFCELNEDMAASGIRFVIDFINYIPNSSYTNHSFGAGQQMMAEHNVDGVVNAYIVDNFSGICGYYSGSGDAVVNVKSCIEAGDNTWAHEMGHFFSLPHTFSGWEGEDWNFNTPAPPTINGRPVEKVDGSNCAVAADGFCDTPPDYISSRWACNAQGLSNYQLDPDSVRFFSDGSLYMSYSFDVCSNRFSDEQIAAMRANIVNFRPELLTDIPAIPPIEIEDFKLVGPLDSALVNPQQVTFRWEPVPNATHYQVEVSRIKSFPNFGGLTIDTVITQTDLTLFDLEDETRYYWKVSPTNDQDNCAGASDVFTFETSLEVTNTFRPAADAYRIQTFPNPVSAGSTVQLRIEAPEAGSAFLEWLSITGQSLGRQVMPFNAGISQFALESGPEVPGVYLLRIRAGELSRTERIIVR